MRCLSICLFLNLFVCLAANGQRMFTTNVDKHLPDSCKKADSFTFNFSKFSFLSPGETYVVNQVPASFYVNSMGFFCKKELQLEKAVKFPVKMRLGSVPYTDKMEGKITARSTE